MHKFDINTNFTCLGVNYGIFEGLNLKIQLTKRRDKGFADIDNFIDTAYFVCGKLKFDYPYDSL
ncbi:MAG: transposase [Prevotellaceae bacterium]|nr:transposase [Prevotellaceae bacterium]